MAIASAPGYNGDFNPLRDAQGRYAPRNSGGRTPPPNAREHFGKHRVRVLQDAGRGDGAHYAELWHGNQFVSDVRLTRAYRTELAGLVTQAQQLARPPPPTLAPAAQSVVRTPGAPLPREGSYTGYFNNSSRTVQLPAPLTSA